MEGAFAAWGLTAQSSIQKAGRIHNSFGPVQLVSTRGFCGMSIPSASQKKAERAQQEQKARAAAAREAEMRRRKLAQEAEERVRLEEERQQQELAAAAEEERRQAERQEREAERRAEAARQERAAGMARTAHASLASDELVDLLRQRSQRVKLREAPPE